MIRLASVAVLATVAAAWRVPSPDGDVLGEHELLHDHADEQSGVEVPPGTDEVLIEPRDLENGYGGERVRVRLGP